ncbi:MAG: hypothetical protein D084_Lepto4C00002G0001 [Leptospirillum sp. Group IV 'UBA BS']|nr:MAG: hypothetical protein D084_Lepto4C00002G0001 [Leptospirillum sp. Group IV 'UBA BS']
MDAKVKELVGIAASVAAGCETCLQTHIAGARQQGADQREIQTAVNIARAVRLQAATRIDTLATQMGQHDPVELVMASSGGCGPNCKC